MIRRRLLTLLVALFAAVACLPVTALADEAIEVVGYTIFGGDGVGICTYQTKEEAERYGDIANEYPELTMPEGGRSRYLRYEYGVPIEFVGGEDVFKYGLAKNWNWNAPDVTDVDGFYVFSGDSFGQTSAGLFLNGVMIRMVPDSQQPVEKAVITVTGTNAAGQVTDFTVDLVYASEQSGRDVAVSGGSGVGMRLMPNAWLKEGLDSGTGNFSATATSLSGSDPAASGLVSAVNDGEVVGVFDFDLVVGSVERSDDFGVA